MKNNITKIESLALTGKKVFTIEDLAVIWQIPERRKLIELVKYYTREKRLTRIHKGVYAYGTGYTPLDIAQKLSPLSYVSLYTASQIHGLTFQDYNSVFCISLKNKKYKIGNQSFVYHRIKESVFYNQSGLINNGRYFMADIERTVCDCLYLFPGFSFDNLKNVDKKKLQDLSGIYNNSRLGKDIANLIAMID